MIVVKVGEPKTKQVGDYWFDPTTRTTQRADARPTSQSGAVLVVWTPIVPNPNAIGMPINPTKGDVHIEPVNCVPSLFDGTSWIPAVPKGYIFPPFVPKDGDCWTCSQTQISYMYFNGAWTRMVLQQGAAGNVLNGNGQWVPMNVSSQRPPPQVVPPGGLVNINVAPGAAPVPNLIITNTNSQFHTAAANNITIHGPHGQNLVTINTLTGVCSFGPGYTPDAASQVFWRALASTSPRFLQAQIEGLVQDLKDATSRLAVAEGNVLKFTQAGFKLPEPQKPLDPLEAWERAMGIIK